jgi:hypothetical protein
MLGSPFEQYGGKATTAATSAARTVTVAPVETTGSRGSSGGTRAGKRNSQVKQRETMVQDNGRAVHSARETQGGVACGTHCAVC